MPPHDRLSALDASFLYLEHATTPMHVGSVAVFAAPSEGLAPADAPAPGRRRDDVPVGLDHDRLLQLIESRISLVPRYRQKVRSIPGRLAAPVWVDDADFDLSYHVRRSALPRPGSDAQLQELVGRLMSRRLDRSRPLWEMYFVEGLSGGRVAVITKNHHAMVDGVTAVNIATVILDSSPQAAPTHQPEWRARREPSSLGLLAGAAQDLVRSPGSVVDTVRREASDLRATGARVAQGTVGLLAAARSVTRAAPESPLNVTLSQSRRFAVARTELEDYRAVRAVHGGTVNDVVLAVVSGALRSWLMTRGEAVGSTTVVRALVPVSVESSDARGGIGNRVSSYFVDLPVGEQSPVVRLQRVTYAMTGHGDGGASVSADSLVALSGFAPPTLHSLGARAASSVSRRLFNLVVTNVPGPQQPLYAGAAQMQEVFPVVPLAQGQAVTVGVTSYDGGVYFGLNADRDAMADVEVLAACLTESLDELVGTVR